MSDLKDLQIAMAVSLKILDRADNETSDVETAIAIAEKTLVGLKNSSNLHIETDPFIWHYLELKLALVKAWEARFIWAVGILKYYRQGDHVPTPDGKALVNLFKDYLHYLLDSQ